MQPDIQKLLKRLDKAFRTSKFPGSMAARVGDRDEIASFLGKTWQEVTADDINRTDSLIFFFERGLVYYLPSYLRVFATSPKSVKYHVFVQFIGEIGDPKFTQRKKYREIEELCSLFSEEQITVIRDFIQIFELFVPEPAKPLSTFPEAIQAEKDRVRNLIHRAFVYWDQCLAEK